MIAVPDTDIDAQRGRLQIDVSEQGRGGRKIRRLLHKSGGLPLAETDRFVLNRAPSGRISLTTVIEQLILAAETLSRRLAIGAERRFSPSDRGAHWQAISTYRN